MLNIMYNNKDETAVDETLHDTFQDISVYGVIAQIVLKEKWGK